MAETATTPTPETSPAADAVDEIITDVETPTEEAPETPADEAEEDAPGGELSAYDKAMAILKKGRPDRGADTEIEETDQDPLDGMEAADPLDLSPEQLKTDEGDEPAPRKPTKAEAAAPETPTPEEPADPVEAEKATARVRLNSNRKDAAGNYIYPPKERAAMRLSEDEGISLEAAAKKLYGEDASLFGTQPKAEEAKPAEPAVKAPTSAEIAAKIAELKAQRRAAITNWENESTAELSDKIDDLNREQIRAELREENAIEQQKAQERTQQQTQAQMEADSIAMAAKLYPDADKAGTPLNLKVVERLTELEAANDPILRSPRWAFSVAAQVAAEMGIPPKTLSSAAKPAEAAPGALKPKPAPQPAKAVVPLKKATPVPSAGGVSGGENATLTAVNGIREKLSAAAARGDLAEISRLRREYDRVGTGRRAA